MKRVPVIWSADVDRVAHATYRRATRTLCGRFPVADRFAWPALGRCERCTAALAETPEPEGAYRR